jgi:hypothetical protein
MRQEKQVMSISVIIPTLNEEARLAEILRRVQAEGQQEILVVDGGIVASLPWPVRLHAAQTDSMNGTSASTLSTVAREGPERGPYKEMAVATASSKKALPARPGSR